MLIQGSQSEMIEKAISLLSVTILEVLKKQQHVVLGVPGGRSVAGIYKGLRNCILPWDRIHMFLLDERLVPVDHPESNYKLIKEHLGRDKLPAMIHPFIYNTSNPSQSITDYEKDIEQCGGRFDIVLASSGEDGHIASLFPNHHSAAQKKSGFLLINDSPKPPPGRMSASHDLIRQADTGIVLFFGSSKENALHNFYNKELSFTGCPAKIITELQRYYVLTDQEVHNA